MEFNSISSLSKRLSILNELKKLHPDIFKLLKIDNGCLYLSGNKYNNKFQKINITYEKFRLYICSYFDLKIKNINIPINKYPISITNIKYTYLGTSLIFKKYDEILEKKCFTSEFIRQADIAVANIIRNGDFDIFDSNSLNNRVKKFLSLG